MKNNHIINFDLNAFLKNIKLKKNIVIKSLKHKIILFNKASIKKKIYFHKCNALVVYIVCFSFSKSNSFLCVSDSAGNLKFFCSAGSFNHTGKNKKLRFVVLKNFYNTLLNLEFLKNKPIALHLKNIKSEKPWIIKNLKKKFFIAIVRTFNMDPHNGCRKKKIRRKKLRKKRRSG